MNIPSHVPFCGVGGGGGGFATFCEKNDSFGYISNLILVW
jgi:hypothetical protein